MIQRFLSSAPRGKAFRWPLCDCVDQYVEDFASGIVVLRLVLLMQVFDYINRRAEVVQNRVNAGKRLELVSGCLCAKRVEQ